MSPDDGADLGELGEACGAAAAMVQLELAIGALDAARVAGAAVAVVQLEPPSVSLM